MEITSEKIRTIYKSRGIILNLLEINGYDIADYDNFSVNDVDAMTRNEQLDMLLTHENGKKTFIKYVVKTKKTKTQMKSQFVNELIEQLMSVENILTKKDDIIIIVEDEPNDNLINTMKYLYDNSGVFIVIHNIKRLQFNILEHNLVPKSRVLNDEETELIKKKYNIHNLKQLPEVSRFDPQSLAMCMRPGQVCEYTRKSPTTIETKYYRVCV